MTEDLKYLLKASLALVKASLALAVALTYLEHVNELKNGADMELIDEAKRQIMRAYDRCTFLYEVLK